MNTCVNFEKKKFGIQQLTRLKEDKCFLEEDIKRIKKPGSYQTTNYRDCDCEIPNVA